MCVKRRQRVPSCRAFASWNLAEASRPLVIPPVSSLTRQALQRFFRPTSQPCPSSSASAPFDLSAFTPPLSVHRASPNAPRTFIRRLFVGGWLVLIPEPHCPTGHPPLSPFGPGTGQPRRDLGGRQVRREEAVQWPVDCEGCVYRGGHAKSPGHKADFCREATSADPLSGR